MYDDAKLFLLKQQLEEHKKNKRNAIVFAFTICIILGFITPSEFYYYGLALSIFGGTAIATLANYYYNKKITPILLQIERLAYENKCPNCQKKIPEKNKFIYCPYCRAPLSSIQDII